MNIFHISILASWLILCLDCHSSTSHNDHDHQNEDLESKIDLHNIFKQYGNSTRSMNPGQLREFLDDFQLNYFQITFNKSERLECLSKKIANFKKLTSSWNSESIIDRTTFAKVSSYLAAYVNKCFGTKFNKTENYVIKPAPVAPTMWQKLIKTIPMISKEKWLYAFISVFVISIVGLLCVIFVPILNACCFDYLFQFLVALALGTLLGDALLHLIPHAFMGSHSHDKLMFLDDFNSDQPTESHQASVFKGLGCLLGMYVFFLIEKLVQMRQVNKPKGKKGEIQKLDELMKNEYDSSEIEQFETPKRSQNHVHGHSHGGDKAKQLKSNAWMVILGDALHNFSDGLAIGASFAINLTTGFGTTIAVFFHELPHEIGDFAVLRRAGVPMKKAVLFNVISSVLCFVGVIVGLFIGGIEALNQWSFLFIAGTFIYISLVDIIPELNENETVYDTKILNFFIQNFGIFLGVGIMLLIALYEDDIHSMLG